MLTTLILQIGARILPEPNRMEIALIAPDEHSEYNPSASLQLSDGYIDDQPHSIRQKREAAYDPYAVYYFYPSSLSSSSSPSYNSRPAYYQSYINRRDTDDNRLTEKGQKYKYTPLFQYKSTQSKRRKLFVPNLFG